MTNTSTRPKIMATDTSKRLIWEELILNTLNTASPPPSFPFILLKSGQLVGAAHSIFIRSDHISHVRNLECCIKKTGLAGLAGNKGGVSIRMDFFDTSLCFVCAHLAAGHSNVEDRNRDYKTITQGLAFSKGRKIPDHDVVVWLGDFNYRVDLTNEDAREKVLHGAYESMLRFDQVRGGCDDCSTLNL